MKVLLNKTHPLGRSFVAQLSDGKFKVGASEKETKVYDSAQEAYDHYIGRSGEDHGAWNICYTLEDYL